MKPAPKGPHRPKPSNAAKDAMSAIVATKRHQQRMAKGRLERAPDEPLDVAIGDDARAAAACSQPDRGHSGGAPGRLFRGGPSMTTDQADPLLRAMLDDGIVAAQPAGLADVRHDLLVAADQAPGWRNLLQRAVEAVDTQAATVGSLLAERDANRDMLESARVEINMLRDALGVPVEPHQSLFERMLDAARAMRWIPREERLPEYGDTVFVLSTKHEKPRNRVRVDQYVGEESDGSAFTWRLMLDQDAWSHWMPIPKLPPLPANGSQP